MGAAAVSCADVDGLLEGAPYGAPGPLLLLIGIDHDLRCLPPHDEADPGSKPSCGVVLRMARLRAEEPRELGWVEGHRSPYLPTFRTYKRAQPELFVAACNRFCTFRVISGRSGRALRGAPSTGWPYRWMIAVSWLLPHPSEIEHSM
jgi:hypothetical protein